VLINEHGIEVVRNKLPKSVISEIIAEVSDCAEEYPGHGIRNADKKLVSIDGLSKSKLLIDLASFVLGSEPKVVRVIFFDKTPKVNWLVSWHQDKTIAVSKEVKISGWGPWTVKDGIHHVQPPLEVLNKIVTFRLHLDDAGSNNGCLKVIPESHNLGILSQEEINKVTAIQEPYLCEAKAGDLVMMKPHILHSSSKSVNPEHRRVVHIEYSNYELPENLTWA
jgi:hypothetical protein